jgi:hypothetical protein
MGTRQVGAGGGSASCAEDSTLARASIRQGVLAAWEPQAVALTAPPLCGPGGARPRLGACWRDAPRAPIGPPAASPAGPGRAPLRASAVPLESTLLASAAEGRKARFVADCPRYMLSAPRPARDVATPGSGPVASLVVVPLIAPDGRACFGGLYFAFEAPTDCARERGALLTAAHVVMSALGPKLAASRPQALLASAASLKARWCPCCAARPPPLAPERRFPCLPPCSLCACLAGLRGSAQFAGWAGCQSGAAARAQAYTPPHSRSAKFKRKCAPEREASTCGMHPQNTSDPSLSHTNPVPSFASGHRDGRPAARPPPGHRLPL